MSDLRARVKVLGRQLPTDRDRRMREIVNAIRALLAGDLDGPGFCRVARPGRCEGPEPCKDCRAHPEGRDHEQFAESDRST
jgi:hypothetical protein